MWVGWDTQTSTNPVPIAIYSLFSKRFDSSVHFTINLDIRKESFPSVYLIPPPIRPMSNTFKVAIAGFSGKMARLTTNALIRRHPNVEINGILRSPGKVRPDFRNNSKIKLFEAALSDSAAIRRGVAGTDICICCYLGGDELMIEGQKVLIDVCIAEGVPRYMGSDWSFNYGGLKLGDHPAKDWMLKYKAYLDKREEAAEIKGVHVLNGAFMEAVHAPFLGFVDALNAKFTYYGTGDEKLEMTTMLDAAEFTAEVVVDPHATGYVNCKYSKSSSPRILTR